MSQKKNSKIEGNPVEKLSKKERHFLGNIKMRDIFGEKLDEEIFGTKRNMNKISKKLIKRNYERCLKSEKITKRMEKNAKDKKTSRFVRFLFTFSQRSFITKAYEYISLRFSSILQYQNI